MYFSDEVHCCSQGVILSKKLSPFSRNKPTLNKLTPPPLQHIPIIVRSQFLY